jgi:hypothetical protein
MKFFVERINPVLQGVLFVVALLLIAVMWK